MDNHTATEIAYKNGYEQGKKDAVKEQSKWISIHDAYPDEGVKVLGYSADSGNYCVGNYCKRWNKWRAAGSPKVTHWMPLPEPPKEEV